MLLLSFHLAGYSNRPFSINPNRKKMKKNYALHSLELITQELNTQLSVAKSEEEIAIAIQRIRNEKVNIYNSLQNQIFNSKEEEHTRLLVRKYFNALVTLINKAYHMLHNTPDIHASNYEILEFLSIILFELQQFLELSYSIFLNEDERVPIPELVAIKSEIQTRLLLLPNALKQGNNPEKISEIVIGIIEKFIERIDRHEPVTVKEAEYHTGLLRALLRPSENRVLPDCPTLHELLFYWNCNSVECIVYFTTGLKALMEQENTDAEKISFLNAQFKRLLHMPVKPGIIYDRNYPSMKSYFTEFIKTETDDLRNGIEHAAPVTDRLPLENDKATPKVVIKLSIDQISIIALSAYRKGYISAKSFSEITRALARNVSTEHSAELNWKSVRGKGYNVERRDQEISAQVLDDIKKGVFEFT